MKEIITTTDVTMLNEKNLSSLLNLPLNDIKFLIDNNILKTKRVGDSYGFNMESVNEFKYLFNRGEFFTVAECERRLDEMELFYIDREDHNQFISDLGIYITLKKLIKGGKHIPNEYRLDTVWIGTTKYISAMSFNVMMRRLMRMETDSNPKWAAAKQITVRPFSKVINVKKDSKLYKTALKLSVLGRAKSSILG